MMEVKAARNRLLHAIRTTVAPMLTEEHCRALEAAADRFLLDSIEEGIVWDDVTIVARHEHYGSKRRRVRATDNRSKRGISWVEGVFSKAGRNISVYAAGMDFGEFPASRLQKFGDKYQDVSSAVLGESGIIAELESQRDALWSDLENAVRRAINGCWSMECDWILERIQSSTKAIYRPTPWVQVPIPLLPIWLDTNLRAFGDPRFMEHVERIDWDKIRRFTADPDRTAPVCYTDIPLSDVTDGKVKLR